MKAVAAHESSCLLIKCVRLVAPFQSVSDSWLSLNSWGQERTGRDEAEHPHLLLEHPHILPEEVNLPTSPFLRHLNIHSNFPWRDRWRAKCFSFTINETQCKNSIVSLLLLASIDETDCGYWGREKSLKRLLFLHCQKWQRNWQESALYCPSMSSPCLVKKLEYLMKNHSCFPQSKSSSY